MHSDAKFFVIRLQPHQDLKNSILEFARTHKIKAGAIVTCVGSLEQYSLRFANQVEENHRKDFFEIVSLTGTFSDTASHLHLSLSDTTGQTIGGHVLVGNLVYTTAEIVLAQLPNFEFSRSLDPTYGYFELVVNKLK